MAGKKIIKKGKKAGGKIVSGDGEKGSPKVSPKTSPKLPPKESPKTSPKLSPKEAKKAKKAAAKAKPDAPAEEHFKKHLLRLRSKFFGNWHGLVVIDDCRAVEVIRIIKEALKNPEAQKKGVAWTPKDWPTKWKPILGRSRRRNDKGQVGDRAAEGLGHRLGAYGSFSQTNQALASAPKPESAPKGEKRKEFETAVLGSKVPCPLVVPVAENKMKAKKGKGGVNDQHLSSRAASLAEKGNAAGIA
ncbi:unnamed protein product, partial [Cladocopium goreaui]